MKQWITILLCLGFTSLHAQDSSRICEKQLAVLKDAVKNGETFFIKVHAAEALLNHMHKENLELQFLNLRKVPENNIGASRVLAKTNNANRQRYVTEIIHALHSDTTMVRLTALESLGKLNYFFFTDTIKGYADTGTLGFRPMARWVLSNDKTKASENQLAALLKSNDSLDYRYAAYAFSYKEKVLPETLALLKECYARISATDAAKVYLASSIFLHSPQTERPEAKKKLLQFQDGNPGQLYELCEALSVAGSPEDVDMLMNIANHESRDVRVAAANALLFILNCKI